MNVLLGPAHFGDMDEAFDAIFQLDESAVVGDVGDAALEPGAERIFGADTIPRVLVELLHAERNALGLGIDLTICTFTVWPTVRTSSDD